MKVQMGTAAAAAAVVRALMLIGLITVAHADQGLATWYRPPYTPSACFGNQDKGALVAGVSNDLWDGGKICGKRYNVKCAGAANTDPHPCNPNVVSVEVTIVDYCAPCNGTLNLSKDVFQRISYLPVGKIKIDYQPV